MLFDITYRDRKIIFRLNKEIGQPFPLLKRLKMGRIGSGKLEIVDYGSFDELKIDLIEKQYANVELRPLGVILFLKRKYQVFAWTLRWEDIEMSYEEELLTIGDKKTKPLKFRGLIHANLLKQIKEKL